MNNKRISEIVNMLIKCQHILGIALVGSYKKERKYNDIDFLIVCKQKQKVSNYILKEFEKFKTYLNDDSIKVVNYLECEISLAMYDYSELNKKISNYINGLELEPVYKNWNVVGWLPECLLYDLNNMYIIYEKNEIMTNIKKKIYTYPKKMQTSIIKLCEEKINILNGMSGNKIEKQIINSELLALKIRKIFAIKGIYFRGYKRIDKTLKEMGIDINEYK